MHNTFGLDDDDGDRQHILPQWEQAIFVDPAATSTVSSTRIVTRYSVCAAAKANGTAIQVLVSLFHSSRLVLPI